jgi:hypothetical protein
LRHFADYLLCDFRAWCLVLAGSERLEGKTVWPHLSVPDEVRQSVATRISTRRCPCRWLDLALADSYFGGRSSPASQPMASGEVIGSTSSHWEQVGLRGPLPGAGDTNASGLPQRAQFKVFGILPTA